MMKKKNNIFVNIIIILIVLSIVLYFSLKDNFNEIIGYISSMKIIYLFIGILLLILYRVIMGLSSYYVTKHNNQKYSLIRSIQVNIIILFFHGVTPFAGGGGPMEIYYLKKEKIPVEIATNIVLQNFLIYQTALIIVGIFSIIYNSHYNLFPSNSLIRKLVMLGFAINFLVWLVNFVLSFSKKTTRIITKVIFKLLSKIKIIKDVAESKKKLNEYLDNFHQTALQLKNKKLMLVKALMLNIIGLCVLYSIPYVLSLGLRIDNVNIITSIVATTYVMVIGSFIPIPGGTGGLEYGFIYFYGYIVSGGVLTALMLLWRFVSYYIGMIVGAFCLAIYRKKE